MTIKSQNKININIDDEYFATIHYGEIEINIQGEHKLTVYNEFSLTKKYITNDSSIVVSVREGVPFIYDTRTETRQRN